MRSAIEIINALSCGNCRECNRAVNRGQGLVHCPAHEDRNPSFHVQEKNGMAVYECKAECSQDRVTEELRNRGLGSNQAPVLTSTETYHVSNGKGGFVKHIRHDYSDGSKNFVWDPKGTSSTQLLYNSEKLRKDGDVIIAEGEKAADALRQQGFDAIGTVCGAHSCPSEDALRIVAKRKVILWPDNDLPGRTHMMKVAAALAKIGTAEVRMVNWKLAPYKGDAHDWCQRHNSEATSSLLWDAEKYDSETAKVRLGEVARSEILNGSVEAPTIARMGAGYALNFPSEGVYIEIPSLYRHSNLDISVLMNISWQPPGVPSAPRVPLDWTKQNLYGGSRTRETLAKGLKERVEADWKQILHQTWSVLLDLENSGEEPVALPDVELHGPAQQLLGQFALDESPTMIYGHGGDGKSLLALAMGVTLQTGWPILGIAPATTKNVLYIDFEADAEIQAERLRAIMRGYLGHEPTREEMPRIDHYPAKGKSLQQLAPQLSSLINRNGYGFAIIDSVSWAAGGPLEESNTATSFKVALDQLAIGTLCVAHVNRDKENQGEMAFGSAFWHDSMRATWYLKKQQESGENATDVVLRHKKSNYGQNEPTVYLRILFENGSIKFQPTARHHAPPELRKQLSTIDRILGAIRDNGGKAMSYTEISEALELSTGAIKNAVTRDRSGRLVTFPQPGFTGNGRAPTMVAVQTELAQSSHSRPSNDRQTFDVTIGEEEPELGLSTDSKKRQSFDREPSNDRQTFDVTIGGRQTSHNARVNPPGLGGQTKPPPPGPLPPDDPSGDTLLGNGVSNGDGGADTGHPEDDDDSPPWLGLPDG